VTGTLTGTTLALLAGAVATAAIYWGFLNTPESTVWMLALSAVLAVAAASVAAITIGAVLLAWSGTRWSRAMVLQALRGVPACVPPALVVLGVWWLALRGTAWMDSSSGEISAWFIARFGWSDVSWLFRTVEWIGWWVRWVVAPFIALVWCRSILVRGWRPSRTLVREALRPSGVLIATVIVLALVWMPWTQLAPWRPRGLAPGTGELLFVGAKLGLVAVLSALGWSLVARVVATRDQT
jgi:hypothetical protein